MLNLDTHILIRALIGELYEHEQALLMNNEWSISAIVHWEIAKLAQLGRVDLDMDDRELERSLHSIRLWPIDFAIARASTRLDFSADPADEIIAATSLVHDVPLLTRDKVIRGSKIVPLAG